MGLFRVGPFSVNLLRALRRTSWQKSNRAKGLVGVAEHLVDRRNHTWRGAVVIKQSVHGLGALRQHAGRHIGGQVGTAKTVNRLLGVANQQQRHVAGLWVGVNGRQSAPLPRVSVLKFIDQRHRVLLANRLGQTRSRLVQGGVQAGQQVCKVKLTTLLFAVVVTVRNGLRGVGQQSRLRRWGITQRIAPGLHGRQRPGRVLGLGAADFGFFRQSLQAKFGHQFEI